MKKGEELERIDTTAVTALSHNTRRPHERPKHSERMKRHTSCVARRGREGGREEVVGWLTVGWRAVLLTRRPVR